MALLRSAKLHPFEWLVAAYFTYVAWIAPFFAAARGRTLAAWTLAAAIVGLMLALARIRSPWRDWMPILYTLIAYRQMDWFTPPVPDHRWDLAFIPWDRWLLDDLGLRASIERTGSFGPNVLELSYLLVYAVAPVAVWILYAHGLKRTAPRFWLAYLAGTLGAYALLPYFPSQPPRTAFTGHDLPHVLSAMRRLNLLIVGSYGIHSSVFPSAHVSSVFGAAWGLLATLPQRRRFGIAMAAYGCAVGIATVYGRYHYAVDVVAGLLVSLAAVLLLELLHHRLANLRLAEPP